MKKKAFLSLLLAVLTAFCSVTAFAASGSDSGFVRTAGFQASPAASAQAILNSAPLTPTFTGHSVADAKLQELLSIARGKGNDAYTLVKGCYDYLVDNTRYGEWTGSYPYDDKQFGQISYADSKLLSDAWGPFTEHVGGCRNYSAAFLMLTRAIGLDAHKYYGQTRVAGTQTYTYHEWVEININGVDYLFDPQVEGDVKRATGENKYMYFCKTEAEMKERFTWASPEEIAASKRPFTTQALLTVIPPDAARASTLDELRLALDRAASAPATTIYFTAPMDKLAVQAMLDDYASRYSLTVWLGNDGVDYAQCFSNSYFYSPDSWGY